MPASKVASRETGSTSRSRSSERRSSAITAAKPSRTGSTPPTTLVPPPKGTTATRSRAHASSTASTSSADPGCATASGALEGVSRAEPDQIGVAAPGRMLHARGAIVAQAAVAEDGPKRGVGTRGQRGIPHPHLLERHRPARRPGLHSQLLLQEGHRRVGKRGVVPVLPPAPPAHG